MRGASADSLAALVDQMTSSGGVLSKVVRWASKVTGGSTAVGTTADGADAERLADDLFGVAAVLRSEPALRRTVTDLTIPADAKAGLVRQIFGDAVAPDSLDLLTSAVGRRWTATRDLGDALEHLGVIAVVRAAEQRGEADALENQLFAFERLVSGNPDLRDALSDPARSVADKRRLVNGLLEGKATSGTIKLAEQALSGSHRTVAVALESYQKIAADHRQGLVATVRVARPLSDRDAQRLQDALTRQYSRPVHLNVVVDPDVLGGISVSVGDDVIDGTVASRLDEARRKLVG